MAKTGFTYIVAAELDPETEAYSGGKEFGAAASMNFNPNTTVVNDFGSNRVVESSTDVRSGNVTIEKNNLSTEDEAFLLGHEITEGEMVSKDSDVAPYLGFGFVGTSIHNNQAVYVAKVYHKIKFTEGEDANSTGTDQTAFNHTTLGGAFYTLKTGEWKSQKEFNSEEAAIAYVNQKLNITE